MKESNLRLPAHNRALYHWANTPLLLEKAGQKQTAFKKQFWNRQDSNLRSYVADGPEPPPFDHSGTIPKSLWKNDASKTHFLLSFKLIRLPRIELGSPAHQTGILPLNYRRYLNKTV